MPHLRCSWPLGFLLVCLAKPAEADPPNEKPSPVHVAVRKSLTLIQKSTAEYRRQRGCFSCHHQTLPILAVAEAKKRGFEIDEKEFEAQLDRTADHLGRGRAGYLRGRAQGGGVDTAANGLWALEAGGRKRDDTTDAVVEYLLGSIASDHWRGTTSRPPTQTSDLTRTAAALRGLAAFGKDAQQDRIDDHAKKARHWFRRVEAKDTEDRASRLRALAQLGEDRDVLVLLALDLAVDQRDDGGFAQRPGMESDAYATGSALVSLHKAGVPVTDKVYQHGVKFLLESQLDDGSWHVRTRSRPIQRYFESGFPHGKDQFISIGASCWATRALLLTLPSQGKNETTTSGDKPGGGRSQQ